MKNKKYHTVRTIPKSNINIVEREQIDTPNTQIRITIYFLHADHPIRLQYSHQVKLVTVSTN